MFAKLLFHCLLQLAANDRRACSAAVKRVRGISWFCRCVFGGIDVLARVVFVDVGLVVADLSQEWSDLFGVGVQRAAGHLEDERSEVLICLETACGFLDTHLALNILRQRLIHVLQCLTFSKVIFTVDIVEHL